MRWPILAILAVSHPVLADGAYVSESLGGANYDGDLARFGSGAPRVQLAGGYVHGPWAVELSVTGLVPDLFFIDCYGAECAAAAAPALSMTVVGLDVRHAWRVIYSTWTNKIGLDFVLHGGPRTYVADDALAGYRGFGIGGGAAFDLNLKVFSMFVDFSTDLVELHGDGDTYLGRLPSVMVGGRLGWM